MRQKLDTSERRTCRTVGMARSTQQYKARKADDDEALHLALIWLSSGLPNSMAGMAIATWRPLRTVHFVV